MGHTSSQFAGMLRAIVLGAVALALGPGILSSPASAQGKHSLPEEHQLKAAFVFNLIPFVEWPAARAGERLVVGFAGEGPMETALQSFFKEQGPRASGIEMRVVHGRNELRACHVLFLAYPDGTRMREALAQLQGASVLTIGDGEAFVRMGGVIGFEAQGNKLRLLVNPNAAQRARLRISAKLMSMSTAVPDEFWRD
ncbi:MAG: YfiR family protein [Acidobacteriia bacterium]|nr:YfiR family protein [Terriglobia bacterium]